MKNYKYTEASAYTAALSFRLRSLEDFCRFLDQHQYRSLFLLLNEEMKPLHFAAVHLGALVYRETDGFKALEDYHEAMRTGFPDAATFYDARLAGCKSYSEFKTAMGSGAADVQQVVKIREGGYMEGYAVFTEMKKYHPAAAGVSAVNAARLYEWASGAGFRDFNEMREALQRGFTEAAPYRAACEKKFTNAADYEAALEGFFEDAATWERAKAVQAKDRSDLLRYDELNEMDNTGLKADEKVFLLLLSKLPQHKKLSVNKMKELYQQELDRFRYAETGELPPWFDQAFSESYTCAQFLQQNKEVQVFGTYDADGEYFETRRLQDRKVVIDGSNVAYNSRAGNAQKPRVKNIIRMVDALKQQGFTAITVMSDASLSFQLEDPALLPQLQEQVQYLVTPPQEPADLFLLEYVKTHRCLLVSNDNFREWKLKDPWVAQYADFYKLSFLLTEEGVHLPDVDADVNNASVQKLPWLHSA